MLVVMHKIHIPKQMHTCKVERISVKEEEEGMTNLDLYHGVCGNRSAI